MEREKIALVHDHILEFGGAERVLVALKGIFPGADVYLAAYNPSVVEKRIEGFSSWNVRTSWVSHIPFYRKLYSPLRFLAPYIWESFDFSKYDLVISSSGWFMSKGVITKPESLHISYIHHPPSYLYYYQTAIEWQKIRLIKIYAHFINHFLRLWDYKASQRPDVLVANSEETKKRVEKFYKRHDVQVVYPPVAIPEAEPHYKKKANGYYVTLSRIAFKKHIDIIVQAAHTYTFRLKVIGEGRDIETLRKIAGDTVEILGYVPDGDIARIYEGASAFINASEGEEFGIAPVEAMAHGLPVIAFNSGGLKETVKDGYNGYLFDELDAEDIYRQIKKLERLSEGDYKDMQKNARRESKKYSNKVFKEKILKIVNQKSGDKSVKQMRRRH